LAIRIEALGGHHNRATFSSGRGVGELLLADAIRRGLGGGRSIAVFAIVVDAKDDDAVAFYRRYGFQPFPSRPMRLFLPAKTAAAGFEKI